MKLHVQARAFLAGILLVPVVWCAEDTPPPPAPETVAKQSQEAATSKQAEDGEEQTEPESLIQYKGKITLDPEKAEQEIVGVFECEGKIYPLKPAYPDLYEKLKAWNGKTAVLLGKIGSQDKYFLATNIVEPTPPPPFKRRRGGL